MSERGTGRSIGARKIGALQSLFHATLLLVLGFFACACASAQQGPCAVVSIQIQQKVSLERQAFTAELDINNGLTTSAITAVGVNIVFTDASGTTVVATTDPTNNGAKFFLRQDSLSGIDTTGGAGTIAPATTAVMRWLIIPATGTGGTAPAGALFWVGATLTYTLDGQAQTVNVTPASITVLPQPLLHLDYFLPSDVYADDPFTPQVEPPVPFTLGVRVTNSGGGIAHNLSINSAQPQIIDNKQGLLIDFQLLDSYVDDQPAANTLLINFGDISPQQSRMGRWDMQTTLSGEFYDFTASFTHADALGGALTSLISEQPATHTLIHDVLVDLPGRDSILDFLAKDVDVLRVYESDGGDDVVVDASPSASLGSSSGGHTPLTFTAPNTGLVYVQMPDPFQGQLATISAERSDNKVLPSANVWFSKTRNSGGNWVYYINLFDSNTTGHYTLLGGASANTSSLSGAVFDDVDGNGIWGSGEPGVGGVGVHLHGTTSSASFDADSITDSAGKYQFSSLAAGTYAITVSAIPQYDDGVAVPGIAGGTATAGNIQNIVLASNAAAPGYQFAKLPQTVSSSTADFALDALALSSTTATINSSVTLTATLHNLGPSADSGSVAFLIPAGLSVGAGAASAGVFDSASRIWRVGSLPSGSTVTIAIPLQATVSGYKTIAANAVADSAATDPNLQNNSSSVALTVNSTASINLAESGPTTAQENSVVGYVISLGNGGQTASGPTVVVIDALPPGATFASALVGAGVSAVSCTGTMTLTCTAVLTSALAAGAANGTASFTINATAPGIPGTITNYVSTDPAGGNSAPVPGASCLPAPSCSRSMSLIVAPVSSSTNVTLNTSVPSTVSPNSPLPYSVSLGNSGQVPSGTTLTVSDVLPAGVTFLNAVVGSGVSNVTCVGATTLTCTITLTAALAPGVLNGTASFIINTMSPNSAGLITNYASADPSGGTNPPSAGANCTPAASCSSAITTVVPQAIPTADITLNMSGPASVVVSAPLIYTINLGNSGQVTSDTTLTVSDVLPAGVTFSSATAGAGVSAVSCAGTVTLSCTVTLTTGLGAGVANGAAAFTIGMIAPSAPATITNYISTNPGGGSNPPTPGANCTPASSCSSAATIVTSIISAGPQLTVHVTSPSTAAQGIPYAYRLFFANSVHIASGASLTVSDQLPAGVAALGASVATNIFGNVVSGVNCTNLNIAGALVTCSVTLAVPLDLADDSPAAFDLNVVSSVAATITDYASIDSSGGTHPPTPGPSCTPVSSCDLTITSVTSAFANITLNNGGPSAVVASSPLVYTIDLGNSGQITSGTTLIVNDVLPAGVTFSSASVGAGVSAVSCTGTATLTCTVTLTTGLAAGAVNGTASFMINAIAPAAAGTITNYIATDPAAGTNPAMPGVNCTPVASCSSLSTTVVAGGRNIPLRLVVGVAGPEIATQGVEFQYGISFGNSGSTSYSGSSLTFSDQLPAGVMATSVEPGQGPLVGVTAATCSNLNLAGALVTCTLTLGNTIPAHTATGQSDQFLVYMNVVSSSVGTLTDYASVDPVGRAVPPLPGVSCLVIGVCANAVTVVTPPGPLMQLVEDAPAQASIGVAYESDFVIVNNGQLPSPTTLTIQDQLPDGVMATGASTFDPNVSDVTCNNLNVSAALVTCVVTLSQSIDAGVDPVTGAAQQAEFSLIAVASIAGSAANYASIDPTGGANPPSPGASCTPSASCTTATTTIVAAVPSTASISGSVFVDLNNDGAQGPLDRALAAGVHLHGTTTAGDVDRDITSNASTGEYQFNSLPAGTYALSVATVAGYVDGNALVGSAGGTASAGNIQNIVLAAAVTSTGYRLAKLPQTAPGADFAIDALVVSSTTVASNNDFTVTATLHNYGPATDSGSVAFAIPAEIAVSSNIASTGMFDPTTRVWHVGNLVSGTTATLRLTLQAALGGDETISAVASVDAAATDPNLLNNVANVSFSIGDGSANITLRATGPRSVNAGDDLVYTINLGNSGHGVSEEVITVTDALPAGVTFSSASPGNGVSDVTCTNTRPLICSVTLRTAVNCGHFSIRLCYLPGITGDSENGTAFFTITATTTDPGLISNYVSTDPNGESNATAPGQDCTPAASCSQWQTVVRAPFDLSVAPANRILVIASCPDGFGGEDTACAATRGAAIDAYLSDDAIVEHLVVTRGDLFSTELRSGHWNTYWISGGIDKLPANVLAELIEAVRRGDGLMIDGARDNASVALETAIGITSTTARDAADQTLSTVFDPLLTANYFLSIADPNNASYTFTMPTGRTIASYDADEQAAAKYASVGRGHVLVFAFDLLNALPGTYTDIGEATEHDFFNDLLVAIRPAPIGYWSAASYMPLLYVINTPLQALSGMITATAPVGGAFVSSAFSAPSTFTSNVISWVGGFGQGVYAVGAGLRLPTQDASALVDFAFGSSNDVSLNNEQTLSLSVDSIQTLLNHAQNAVNALVVDLGDATGKANAAEDLSGALVAQTWLSNTSSAIDVWQGVLAEVASITNVDTSDARFALDRLLQATQATWYLGLPVCQATTDAPMLYAGASIPSLYPYTGFESRGGGTDSSDWQWALGGNLRSEDFLVKANTTWISGHAVSWSLTYDGQYGGRFVVADGTTVLADQTYTASINTGPLFTGNALQLTAHVLPGYGSAKIAVTLASLNSHALSDTIATAGDGTDSKAELNYYFPGMAASMALSGTITLTFDGASPPPSSNMDFLVGVGTTSCRTPGR